MRSPGPVVTCPLGNPDVLRESATCHKLCAEYLRLCASMARTARPPLLLLLLACLLACGVARTQEEKDTMQKAIRMKTTRQLKEIFEELGIDSSGSKEELQKRAYKEDAVGRWEELHPEKKKKPRPASSGGGGGGGFGGGGRRRAVRLHACEGKRRGGERASGWRRRRGRQRYDPWRW